jgi:hypothetical protein
VKPNNFNISIFVSAFLLFISVISNSIAGENTDICIKFNLDLVGNHEIESDSGIVERDVETGLSISAEVLVHPSKILSIGIGGTFQFRRGLANLNDMINFNFIPIYGILKIRVKKEGKIIPQLVGHIGYNLFTGNANYNDVFGGLSGRSYYGVGVNFEIGKIIDIELLYKVNNGIGEQSDHGEDVSYDISYSYLSLSFGIYLD